MYFQGQYFNEYNAKDSAGKIVKSKKDGKIS